MLIDFRIRVKRRKRVKNNSQNRQKWFWWRWWFLNSYRISFIGINAFKKKKFTDRNFQKVFFPWEISNWWDNILQRSKVAFLKDTLSLPQRDLLKINHWMIKGWCRKKALLGKTAMHWRKVFSPKNPNLSAGSAVLWIWSRENFRSCQQKIALVHANAFLEYSKHQLTHLKVFERLLVHYWRNIWTEFPTAQRDQPQIVLDVIAITEVKRWKK